MIDELSSDDDKEKVIEIIEEEKPGNTTVPDIVEEFVKDKDPIDPEIIIPHYDPDDEHTPSESDVEDDPIVKEIKREAEEEKPKKDKECIC